jgi:VanZ family protein
MFNLLISFNLLQKYKILSTFALKMKAKMQNIFQIIRKYPISTLLIIGIWVICLIPIPETPLSNVTFIDKYTHIILYLALSLIIAFEFLRTRGYGKDDPQRYSNTMSRLSVVAFILPILMGGIIELVQKYCTNGVRSGDWIDFFADAFGVILAFVLTLFFIYIRNVNRVNKAG